MNCPLAVLCIGVQQGESAGNFLILRIWVGQLDEHCSQRHVVVFFKNHFERAKVQKLDGVLVELNTVKHLLISLHLIEDSCEYFKNTQLLQFGTERGQDTR